MSQQTSAARYRELTASRRKIVDVVAPSGFVFKFYQPNTLGSILGGELPQTAASEAAAAWAEKGVGDFSDVSEETQIAVGERLMAVRDKTVELSFEPKIVIGKAKAANELSTDEIPDEDLTYLFKWVAAGGSGAAMLAMFPEGREQSVVAGIDRSKLRKARKRTRAAQAVV